VKNFGNIAIWLGGQSQKNFTQRLTAGGQGDTKGTQEIRGGKGKRLWFGERPGGASWGVGIGRKRRRLSINGRGGFFERRVSERGQNSSR